MTEQLFVVTYPADVWKPKRYHLNDGETSQSVFYTGIPKGSYIRPINQQDKYVFLKNRNYKDKKVRPFEIIKPDGTVLETWGKERVFQFDWNELSRNVRPATEQDRENLKDKYLIEAIKELW